MRTKLLIAAAVLAGLVAVVPAQAAKRKRAYFLAKVTALQTIKWSSMSRVYTDCNGKQYQRGNGTEVVRIDSGKPEKVTIEGRGKSANVAAYGKWVKGPSLSAIPGLLSDMVVTRQGKIEGITEGGWCGGGHTDDGGPYDCGKRRGVTSMHFDWSPSGRFVELQNGMSIKALKGYDHCPVSFIDGFDTGDWTTTFGKLSPKLLFGKRKTIKVVDGARGRYSDYYRQVSATTSFKLTLWRKHPKKFDREETGAG